MPYIAPPYTDQRRIGVFLPLPSGEVAMPLDIDGEGLPHRSPSPLPPSPGKGDIMVEGAVHLRGAIKNDTVVFSAGRPEAVPYIY